MTTKKSVKKMYCRMFQSVMKAGISTIPWRTPKLMKGAGAVRHLPAAIKRRGLKKALIVTGPTLIGRGLLDGVLEEMEEQGLLYVIYNKVEQNPTDENVEDAVKVFLENGCDCMLALGGGAPLDCAKAVGARIARPNRQIRQLQGLFRVVKQIPMLFAVPTTAGSGSETTISAVIQQMYINGHFCYAYKFGIVTNGLGIVRDITFYNKDFLNAHPNIIVEKKSDSPDEDKSLADSKALLPVLIDFFQKHPLINPKTFLGDAAFDTIEIYKALLDDLGFEKAFIPLRTKLSMEENGYTFNENGVPCCPHDSTLPMKREGSKSHLRSKLPSMKFVCPKMKWEYNRETKTKRRVCRCENPCTTSSCGRMIYIYPEKNLRAYPGVERGSVEWDETYKIRVNVEKSINHFKDSFCIAGRKTQNEKTLHADLLLAGISQLITVMVADKIHQHQYIRSLKPLIA